MIRTLDPVDAQAVSTLEEEVFGADAWSLATIRQELGSSWSEYRGIYSSDGVLIAYGGIKGEWEGDLMTLAVGEDARGSGVGRKLLTDLLARADQRGMRTVFLEVRFSNRVAQRLYEQVGFKEVSVVPRYYRHPFEDAVTMKRDNPFRVRCVARGHL